MCQFCTQHGEGKKWYKIIENYQADLATEQARLDYVSQFVRTVRTKSMNNIKRLKQVRRKAPFAYRFVRAVVSNHMKRFHFGQVVPIEDAEEILDLVHSITRVACVCRSVTVNKQDARYCFLLGIDPTGLVNSWPELESSLETLSKERAKELLRQFDQNGLVHSIWTFQTPFIGAMCNCDHDCLAYRVQIGSNLLNVMFPGEYLATIDPALCVGCRNCQRMCQFGAVEYSVVNQKCVINEDKCYGCGLCRRSCSKHAVSFLEK